jgi:hypothetical protein
MAHVLAAVQPCLSSPASDLRSVPIKYNLTEILRTPPLNQTTNGAVAGSLRAAKYQNLTPDREDGDSDYEDLGSPHIIPIASDIPIPRRLIHTRSRLWNNEGW